LLLPPPPIAQRKRKKLVLLHTQTQQHNYASCAEKLLKLNGHLKADHQNLPLPRTATCVCFNKQENYIPTRYVKQPVGGNKIVQSACGSLCFALRSATANGIRSEILKESRKA
jgi:hypothetical protein